MIARDGFQPVFGDQRAFEGNGPVRMARLVMSRGWGARIFFQEAEKGLGAAMQPTPTKFLHPQEPPQAWITVASSEHSAFFGGRRDSPGASQ